MCFDPVTLAAAASFALTAATSVTSFQAKQQEANLVNSRYEKNYVNSLAAARDQHSQLTVRQMQEQEATAQKDHAYLVEGAQREADVAVSAAGGGVTGISVEALLADVGRQTATQRYNVTRNAEMTAQQLQKQQEGIVTQTQSRINSAPQANDPNPMQPVLEIAGAGLKAYGSMK